ncbi:MAG TPA: ATP-binding cassette domain-containing protein [Anaerolineales bacterium]|nr:ATP-binding cassette domain-containing protein [Anaerolineales bacterium]
MNAVAYALREVTQVYDGRRVLNVGDLTIQEGEILAIVGPNGAGKSTLLRLLNFLERPSHGELTYLGRRVEFPPSLEMRRQITMVFQRPILISSSVRENIAYPLRLRGAYKRDRVDMLLDQFGLARLATASCRKLSGGEYQRVALARALAASPRVLLLDEPTANLDPHNVGLIEAVVQSVRATGRTTQVLVTHNTFQAKRLADRVVMLLDGDVIESGDSERFFDDPQDPRTAAFIRGEMVY